MIRLSQTWYYALQAVIFIAWHQESLVKIRDISESEHMSESLLRRIIADLEKADILVTIRGRNGGISLSRDISKISVYDVLEASGEELGIRDCTKGIECVNKEGCTTTDVLSNIQRWFNSLLKMYTLDKFIK